MNGIQIPPDSLTCGFVHALGYLIMGEVHWVVTGDAPSIKSHVALFHEFLDAFETRVHAHAKVVAFHLVELVSKVIQSWHQQRQLVAECPRMEQILATAPVFWILLNKLLKLEVECGGS